MSTYIDKNNHNFNFNTHFNKFHSSDKDIRPKKETDYNFFLDEYKISPRNSNKNNAFANIKKENKNFSNLFATDFLFSSPKAFSKNNKYNDILFKEQQERNKKIEILLNARLREQKNLERKTQMYFFEEYFSTNSTNLRNISKNDFKDSNKEKIDKYKYDFIKIHKKQIENEKDRRNLLKKLLEKANINNNEIRKSLDIGKFHYFLKSQFEDKSFFDDCCEDSFFKKDHNDKKLVNKSPDKTNFDIFKEKVKSVKSDKTSYEKNNYNHCFLNQDPTPTGNSKLERILPSLLAEQDENFKIIFDRLISGNKRFIETKNRSLDDIFQTNLSIYNTNRDSKIILNINNSLSNVEKVNNLENKISKFFVFACTDCELDIPAIFSLNQEEVFLYRNIGNIIIDRDINFMCAIQYAIENLHIRNFIILGHTNCKALKESIYPTKQGIINKWLKNLRSIAEENRNQLYEAKRDNEKYEQNFSLININEQMKRLSELDSIQNLIKKGEKIYIYGFQLLNNNGKLKEMEVIHSNIQ